MEKKIQSPLDKLISSIDEVRLLIESNQSKEYRKNPASGLPEDDLTTSERAHAAALMRINHAGEVAAQGLYQGHAVFTENNSLKDQMEKAADEELDHLNWCRERVEELGEKTSIFSPMWYAGSFFIGAASGYFFRLLIRSLYALIPSIICLYSASDIKSGFACRLAIVFKFYPPLANPKSLFLDL